MSDKVSGKKVHAYTPGLKLKKDVVVRKTRILPIQGEVLVKKGDHVDFDTVVARAYALGVPEIINAAPKLGVDKRKLLEYMKKNVGDELKSGDVLAENIFLFGMIKRYIYAPFDCNLEHVSEFSGRIIVRGAPIPIDIKAYIPGEVIEVLPEQGVVIETRASFIQGIFGIGGESHGEIQLVVESNDRPITPELITPMHKGKVLFGGTYITSEGIRKAVETGVVGVMTGGIRSVDLKDFLGYDIGVAITGEEDCGITIIATESFGEMPMASHTFDMLKELEGMGASISGTTQIRAGVIRPEIMVPFKKATSDEAPETEMDEGMMPGTRIRAIRAPYFGKLGVVASLPVKLHRLETESKARVVEVKFDDGVKAIIPRANVEIIVK